MTECAHDACTCVVDEEEDAHCSEACRAAADQDASVPCMCGHDDCAGTAINETGGRVAEI